MQECIPSTWDIFYEKNGWMLIFWNFAGVPFVYCFQSVYLAKVAGPIEHSSWYTITLYVILCTAYYIWDTANSQKNHFRMQQAGTYIKRPWALPQLPWQTLKDPQYMTTDRGSKLLISGWWAYARKPHYAADLTMSLCWGLICGWAAPRPPRRARIACCDRAARAPARAAHGRTDAPPRLACAARALCARFGSWVPFIYFAFFFTHLMHRGMRDNERCAKKYGKDWDRYLAKVPAQFVPGVF